MTNKPTLEDFDVYPETGRYMAVISDDIDIFYLDKDDPEQTYLVRIAIAVNKEGTNWGDILSVNYPELIQVANNELDKQTPSVSGFYVINPFQLESKFVPGDFNSSLVPYLLKQQLVKPKGWNEDYDIQLKIKNIPARPKSEGFHS